MKKLMFLSFLLLNACDAYVKTDTFATVSIENNTPYKMGITGSATGNCGGANPLDPNSAFKCTATVTADGSHNTLALIAYKDGIAFMQGNLAFSEMGGVYFDRGWLPANQQNIQGSINANGVNFNQTQNGGKQIIPWNGFQQGGSISVTFSQQ